MTDKEINKEIKIIRKFSKKLLNNSRKADNFFIKLGIYDKKGKITKEYGGNEK